jgi:hypothetical protein
MAVTSPRKANHANTLSLSLSLWLRHRQHFAADPMSRDAYKAEDKMETQAKADKKACDGMKANAKDVCQAEARPRRRSKGELDARTSRVQADEKVRLMKAEGIQVAEIARTSKAPQLPPQEGCSVLRQGQDCCQAGRGAAESGQGKSDTPGGQPSNSKGGWPMDVHDLEGENGQQARLWYDGTLGRRTVLCGTFRTAP